MDYSTLQTERFDLKILTQELVGPEYKSWFSADGVSDFILYAKNDITTEGLKRYVQDRFDNPNALFFGIFLKGSNTHIGNIKFEPIDFINKFTVLGVFIGDEHWRGRKVFTEISIPLESCLQKMNIEKIFLGVKKHNLNAILAYEKQGYSIEEINSLNLDLNVAVTMVKNIK